MVPTNGSYPLNCITLAVASIYYYQLASSEFYTENLGARLFNVPSLFGGLVHGRKLYG